MTTCFLCTNPPVGKCDSCDFGEYCSQEHFEVHKTKDGFCQPFRMRYKKGMGRCLETTRNVKAFEMVLQDTWGIWGTDNNSNTYCLACLANVEGVKGGGGILERGTRWGFAGCRRDLGFLHQLLGEERGFP